MRLSNEGSGLLAAAALNKIIAEERNSKREGQPHQVLQKIRALFQAIVNRVFFGFFLCYHGGNVLQEIDSALLALATFPLWIFAGGAFVTHRMVAALAEARDIAHIGATLRAFDRGPRAAYCKIGRRRSRGRAGFSRGCATHA
jgi:hypothetical protein